MNKQKMIDEIMDNFDFAKVARVMSDLDWEWATHNGGMEIPNEPEIRQEARRLLREVAGKDTPAPCSVECGGFKAEKYLDNDTEVLSLSFVAESWDSYDWRDFE